jgi:hypothetical protein
MKGLSTVPLVPVEVAFEGEGHSSHRSKGYFYQKVSASSQSVFSQFVCRLSSLLLSFKGKIVFPIIS